MSLCRLGPTKRYGEETWNAFERDRYKRISWMTWELCTASASKTLLVPRSAHASLNFDTHTPDALSSMMHDAQIRCNGCSLGAINAGACTRSPR